MTRHAKLWKTLNSKVIFTHKDLKLAEDTVELPNGETASYVRHALTTEHSVIVIALNSRKEVLVQREYSHPPGKVMWQLPGGSMQPGETIEAAAIRELAEESGYSAKSSTVLGSFYIHNRLSDMKQHIVMCTDLFKHNLPADTDEFIETYWISRKEISKMITRGEFDNINLLAALNVWFHLKGEKS